MAGVILSEAKDLNVTDANKTTARILRSNAPSKDEEYAYWQSRPPFERLVAMQGLSFAFFEGSNNEAEIRRRFLRSPYCLPLPWLRA
jgi:hypothetical protein